MDKKIKELNVTNKKRDKRKFHKNVRNLSIVPNVTTLVCKDKGSNITSVKNKYWKDGKNILKNY